MAYQLNVCNLHQIDSLGLSHENFWPGSTEVFLYDSLLLISTYLGYCRT